MESSQFAIVDIETTGGYASASQITEVAIFIYDGEQVIQEYCTLVNPEQPIPFHIQALTGITDEMVKDAPVFSDVAEEIYNLLSDRIFVAHNVHFDYSFIQSSLKNSGYDWKASRLCTVRLSKKVFPNLNSYSLGRLCQTLEIRIQDRHRARGDAEATVTLFQKIQQADHEQIISNSIKHKAKEQRIPTHIPADLIHNLPSSTGIYLFKNSSGKIIYVGKANNIKKRVISHFTGNNTGQRRQSFINEICQIEFQETGTELMAFLLECHYIKKNWPIHNRALKKFEPKYGLLDYEDQNGYIRLSVCQVRKNVRPIYYFSSVQESTQFLLSMIKEFDLDLRLCSFFINPNAAKETKEVPLKLDLPETDLYNSKVTQAIDSIFNRKRSFLIIDKGRNLEEKSYIYYKDNKVYALGFIENSIEELDIEQLISQDNLVINNYYMNHLAESYAGLYPHKVMIIKAGVLE